VRLLRLLRSTSYPGAAVRWIRLRCAWADSTRKHGNCSCPCCGVTQPLTSTRARLVVPSSQISRWLPFWFQRRTAGARRAPARGDRGNGHRLLRWRQDLKFEDGQADVVRLELDDGLELRLLGAEVPDDVLGDAGGGAAQRQPYRQRRRGTTLADQGAGVT